jgi:hypothetical protein
MGSNETDSGSDTLNIKTDTKGDDNQLSGPTGKEIRVNCPKINQNSPG